MRTVLVTDEPLVAEHPLAEAFDQTLFLPPPSEVVVANAASIEDTQIARLVAVAMDQLDHLTSRGDEPFCLWIHSRGMAGPWDAPLALRERLVEEDDPPPMTGSEVPHERLPPDVDPDVVFSANCAYAGQVAAFDTCLGLLAESLRDAPVGQQTLFSLMGARGMPLGEHGLLGPVADRLFGETLHVPWLIRLPSGVGATQRSAALVGPCDMAATFFDWLGMPAAGGNPISKSLLPLLRDETQAVHDRLCMAIDRERAIRTPGWFLRMPEDALPELYVKPDDRWEMNEVANRCEPVVEELVAAWDQFATICRSGEDRQPSPLSAVAESGFE
jgi:arylsulfatase A-like enzyme